jgi:hypothetical protein|tara:strand:+ start:1431 stop:1577 length:147 start_codon:yes stop_codon:yes gene_type:complete
MKEIKVGSEVMADEQWAIVQSIDGNAMMVVNEDGHEFEIDVDLVDPMN